MEVTTVHVSGRSQGGENTNLYLDITDLYYKRIGNFIVTKICEKPVGTNCKVLSRVEYNVKLAQVDRYNSVQIQ